VVTSRHAHDIFRLGQPLGIEMALEEPIGRLISNVDSDAQAIQDFFVRMLRINAVNPRMGGPGERERADFLEGFMKDNGLLVTRVDIEDSGVPGGVRPNLSAKLEGKDGRRNLWYISHMDTVPEGSRGLWKTDPFEPTIRDGKIFARGAEDDGQSLVASLFALLTLKKLELPLPYNVGVWFVADEEFASNLASIESSLDSSSMIGFNASCTENPNSTLLATSFSAPPVYRKVSTRAAASPLPSLAAVNTRRRCIIVSNRCFRRVSSFLRTRS